MPVTKPNIYYVLPYKSFSKSARLLAESFNEAGMPRRGFRMRLQGSSFTSATHRKVINWGNSGGFLGPVEGDILNGNSNRMQKAGNKLFWFEYVDGSTAINLPRIPDFTTDKAGAQSFLLTDHVVCRTMLNSHSGQGIIISEKGTDPNELPDAPLYVKYIPKDAEYRVHIFRTGPPAASGLGEPGAVIDIQKKIRDPNKEPTTWKVRSHQNGFMFIRNGFDTPPDVIEQARRAFQVSDLDFAAVDVIWNAHRGKAYVLELNTAPGLEGQSVEVYANAIKRYFSDQT